MLYNGNEIKGGVAIAQTFAEHFESVYQISEETEFVNNNIINDFDILNISNITQERIIKAIDKLKPKKSMGSDNIPSYVIKGCKYILTEPLQIIFNLSLKNKQFPEKFKIARITPVFKTGNRRDITNYRPIAILSNISKVFELVLYDYIYAHVENRLSNFQHGFMKKRSTCGNLISFVDFITNALANNSQVDVIYTAFDEGI